jgi:hypothetical protein
MMGLSQIDMVSLAEDEHGVLEDGKIQVCGPLKLEKEDSSAEGGVIFAVVRQGNLVAAGRGPAKAPRWRIFVREPWGQAFREGHAVASVTITLRLENPPGLETLSWVQPVKIKSPRLEPAAGAPSALDGTKVGEPQGDELAGQSVASSLAIRNRPTAEAEPEAEPVHTWRHELELVQIPPDPD